MKRISLLALGAATALSAPAAAQVEPYVKGAVGYGVMEDVEVERPGGTGEINPEGDARFMLGAGIALENNWRFDVDLTDRYADGGSVNNNTPTSTDIQNLTLMLNAIYDLNRDGLVNPYLGLGVGAARSSASLYGDFLGPVDEKAESSRAAYQGLAGLGLRLSDRLMADIEYRYVDLGEVSDASFTMDEMVSHDVLIGLRYALTAPPAAPMAAAPPAPPSAPVAAPVAAACENVDFIVYFEWDESALTSQASQTIAAAADQAERCDITRVTVEGHADRSGAASYNVALSERRARTVRDELIRQGVGASAISIEARGESDPAVDTPDGAREPLNRRSEVVIMVAGQSS